MVPVQRPASIHSHHRSPELWIQPIQPLCHLKLKDTICAAKRHRKSIAYINYSNGLLILPLTNPSKILCYYRNSGDWPSSHVHTTCINPLHIQYYSILQLCITFPSTLSQQSLYVTIQKGYMGGGGGNWGGGEHWSLFSLQSSGLSTASWGLCSARSAQWGFEFKP